jgi:hypothetical protein
MRSRPSPATILSTLALFFALGGSALAVSHAIRPQARCADGAVRGIAAVTGDPGKGVANLPDRFSSAKNLFSRAFNCAGGGVQVRRVSLGVYEVRFPGNAGQAAVVSGANALSWLQPLPGGVFRVGLHVPGRDDEAEQPFTVVLV